MSLTFPAAGPFPHDTLPREKAAHQQPSHLLGGEISRRPDPCPGLVAFSLSRMGQGQPSLRPFPSA